MRFPRVIAVGAFRRDDRILVFEARDDVKEETFELLRAEGGGSP